jgi:Ni/Fe-hydrogenase subunit HybB-like protein
MVIVESNLSSKALGREIELPILRDLGRALMGALAVLTVLRFRDLYARGVIGLAFKPGYEAALFQLEIMVGMVLPFVLLAIPRVRRSSGGLYAASLLTVLGFITHRLNVSITGLDRAQGGHYLPAFPEIMITLMLIAVGFVAFNLAARHLPVYPEHAAKGAVRG